MKSPESVPASLRATCQWIVYKLRRSGDKMDKIPVDHRTGRAHDAHDPAIWMTFDDAVAAAVRFDGIGFVFTEKDPFTGIDLDHCVGPDAAIESWAEQVIDCFQSYAEFSPSRKGIHIIITGRFPAGCGHKVNGQGPDGKGAIEAYDRKRFFTFTGDHLEGTPAEVFDRQEEFDAFCRARLVREGEDQKAPADPAPNALSDEDVIHYARTIWPVDRFRELFDDGELTAYDNDWNRADMALCNFLAFWAGGDAASVDRIFRRSALMRDKWDSPRGTTTYGGYTIAKVVGTLGAVYDAGTEKEKPTGKATSGRAKGTAWEPPYLEESIAAEPFPLSVFPPELAEFLRLGAACLTCPVDFLAVPALVVAGSAMGRSFAVKVKDTWVETGALYAALVARPGTAKTPALSLVARPIWAIVEDLIREHRRELALAGKDDPRPLLRRVAVNDTTCEALAPILAENPRGVVLVRDELTAWVAGLNQYKSGGKGADRQFFLSAWSGAAVTVDRKGQHDRGPIHIPHPFLSVVGALTPEMVSELSEANSRDDGFIDRLLFTMPDPVRVRWNTEVIPQVLSDAWTRAIRDLFAQPLMLGPENRPQPFFVRFSPDATTLFAEWHDGHCAEAEGDDFPRYLEGPWSKMRAYCARLALVLDRLSRAYVPMADEDGHDVTAASVHGAIRLIHYFKDHCRRVRGLAGTDNPDARAILKWVRHTRRAVFSAREAKLNFRSRFAHHPNHLDTALAWLETRSCIRKIEIPAKSGGGRPHSGAYEVNPVLLE